MNRLATAVGLLVFGLVLPARAQQAPAPDVNELANKRPMNVGVQYYYNVERPDGSAGQQLRFTIALLFPAAPGGK